jgi:hypothetical protein
VLIERGLCDRCVHARVVTSSRGSSFVLCRRSVTDPRFPRYPALPVFACAGYEAEPATMARLSAPLVIEFAAGSRLHRESDRPSQLPIAGNGPPGTFVLLPGLKVSLPTDQIVFADDTLGLARIGFGGMRFTGIDDGQLTFIRVRELRPEAELSPARSHRMRLAPEWVSAVYADDALAWPS